MVDYNKKKNNELLKNLRFYHQAKRLYIYFLIETKSKNDNNVLYILKDLVLIEVKHIHITF